jgi:predicted AAA+ superfamily ATPase
VTNLSGLARDAGVARPTVERYFDVLSATMIASRVAAWRPHAKVKESAHPKIYFFDPGVVRAIRGRLREPLDDTERGFLLETLVLHEMRAHQNASNCGGVINYWATPSQQEVDFVWSRGERNVGIEVKSSTQWRHEFGRTLRELHAEKVFSSVWGVYLGDKVLRDGPLEVLPLPVFLQQLNEGRIFA